MEKYDVFISYRRKEYLIADLLETSLGKDFIVFHDRTELQSKGAGPWTIILEKVIKQSQVFLLAIGPEWLSTDSISSLFTANDPVRNEILTAIDNGIMIIPVLFNGAKMPKRSDLPLELAMICDQQKHDLPVSGSRIALLNLHKRIKSIFGKEINPADCAKNEWQEMLEITRSTEYRKWQDDYLYKLYESQTLANKGNWPLLFPTVADTRYAIACYLAADGSIPFEHIHLCTDAPKFRETRELPDLNISTNVVIPDWVKEDDYGDLRTRYFELLSYNKLVRRWNMRGFALDGLILDPMQRVIGYKSNLCTYGENCLSSHVLGYELYKQYIQDDDRKQPKTTMRPEITLLSRRPKDNEVLYLSDKSNFYPLIGVQALVAFRPSRINDDWELLVMERSTACSSYPGFWQFTPAGGFEVYGTEKDRPEYIKRQFDMRLALIRELLEEIFGDRDMTCEDTQVAQAGHQGSPGFQQIMKSISSGLNIHFLGVVTELVGLRSEFSFLIVIEDPEIFSLSYPVNAQNGGYARWMRGSNESNRLIPMKFEDIQEYLSSEHRWNPSSIGLIKLFAEQAKDESGWLRTTYPTMPQLTLSD